MGYEAFHDFSNGWTQNQLFPVSADQLGQLWNDISKYNNDNVSLAHFQLQTQI